MKKLFEEPEIDVYSFVTEEIMTESSLITDEDYYGQGDLELPAI